MAMADAIRTEFDRLESITGGTEKELDQLWEACLAAKGPEVLVDSILLLTAQWAASAYQPSTSPCLNPKP